MTNFCLLLSVVWLMLAMGPSAAAQTGAVTQVPVQSGVVPSPRVERQAKRQVTRLPPKNQSTNGQRVVATRQIPKQQLPSVSFSDAQRRFRHERHDRAWWRSRYRTIVFVGGGYYFWDAGYWFPAWGYDPLYDNYDYDGPIFTYGNLLPDQVIINVQRALQQLGYYGGGLTGSIGPAMRAAIVAYQEDAGLDVTGGIDAPTVASLGLY
jgi:hypothetical protein